MLENLFLAVEVEFKTAYAYKWILSIKIVIQKASIA